MRTLTIEEQRGLLSKIHQMDAFAHSMVCAAVGHGGASEAHRLQGQITATIIGMFPRDIIADFEKETALADH